MLRALGYFLPESSVILPIDTCPILAAIIGDVHAVARDGARREIAVVGILEIERFTDSADEKIALNVAFDKFLRQLKRSLACFGAELPRLESLLLLTRRRIGSN